MNRKVSFLTILPASVTTSQRFWIAPSLRDLLFGAGFNFSFCFFCVYISRLIGDALYRLTRTAGLFNCNLFKLYIWMY